MDSRRFYWLFCHILLRLDSQEILESVRIYKLIWETIWSFLEYDCRGVVHNFHVIHDIHILSVRLNNREFKIKSRKLSETFEKYHFRLEKHEHLKYTSKQILAKHKNMLASKHKHRCCRVDFSREEHTFAFLSMCELARVSQMLYYSDWNRNTILEEFTRVIFSYLIDI